MVTFYIVLSILFSVLSGFFEGKMDYLQFHYYKPSNFWNTSKSWKNKWKDGDPEKGERFWQSSRALVFLTDGWHLMKFFRNLFLGLTICSLVLFLGYSIWIAIIAAALFRGFYGLGFMVSYK